MVLLGLFLLVLWLVVVFGMDIGTSHMRTGQAQSLRMDGAVGLRGNRTRTVSGYYGIRLGPDLSRRRRWYAEGDGDGGSDDKGGGTDKIDLSTLTPEIRAYIEQKDARIKELNAESAGRRVRLNEIEAERVTERAALMQRLEESGNWKQLAEERSKELAEAKIDAARADVYAAQIQASNEVKVAQIPDEWRDVVPELPPERLSVWLDANMVRFTTPIAPDLNAGTSTNNGKPVKLTAEEQMAFDTGDWADMEEYLKYKR